jgi:hypothetical protein
MTDDGAALVDRARAAFAEQLRQLATYYADALVPA